MAHVSAPQRRAARVQGGVPLERAARTVQAQAP